MTRLKKQISHFLINFSIIGELFQFLWEHKLWWSIPVIIIMLLLMSIVIFGQSSGLAPFIYPLF